MSNISFRSLGKLADAAFEQVAVHVIQQAKLTGTPVIVWQDGRVQAVPAEEMEKRLKRSARKKKPKPKTGK